MPHPTDPNPGGVFSLTLVASGVARAYGRQYPNSIFHSPWVRWDLFCQLAKEAK